MTEKIACGGLMERGDLSLVEVLGFDWRPGEACGILGKFGQAGMALSYLSIGNGADGGKNMSFCVKTTELATHRKLLAEIETEYSPRRVAARSPVVILTLYGPHFLEKRSLASEVFSALCVTGVNAHTVCSSVNSISVVVDVLDRDGTVACLRERFTWPE